MVKVQVRRSVVANALFKIPPVLPTVVLQPGVPTKADVLRVDVSSATDADGDSVTAEIVWYLDGSPLSTAQTLNLSDVNFEKGQEIRAVVRPFDGTISGTSTTTSTVVIQNSLPTISSVTFDPVMVFTDDTVAAQVDVVDLDGDAITLSYQWSIGSSIVGTSDSLDGTLHFKKGDVVQLMVTPSDGASGTSFTAPGITIQNSPPTGHTVSITPDKPMAGVTPLVCAVDTNATDADGDSIQYSVSWTQNTTTFTGATTTTLTNDTVGASDLDGDDVWTCSVTPSDGTDTGIEATHSVVIAHPWEQISAGAQHSCGVDTTGQVVCWGDSSDGQTSPPSRVFDTIDAGGFHNCGVSAGNVYCWGRDTDKQVSDAPTAGSYAEVALGVKHSCSRNSSGNLECWGRDLSGCTTLLPAASRHLLSVNIMDVRWTVLGMPPVGEGMSMMKRVHRQRQSYSFPLGHLILVAFYRLRGLNWGDNANGVVSTAPAATGYQRLACGKVHCCAINASDGIDCWGDDSAGQEHRHPRLDGRILIQVAIIRVPGMLWAAGVGSK